MYKFGDCKGESKYLTKYLGIAFALTLLAVPGPSSKAADVFRFSGEAAFADFSSTAGCLETFVFIFAVDNKQQQPPGPGGTSSEAFVGIFQFDSCSFETTLDAFGSVSLGDADFTVEKQLASATLDAEVELFDFVSQAAFTVDVHADWTAIGNVERSNSHFHVRSPDFFLNSHSRGQFRPAEASATVSDGTTNFTPEPTNAASIRLDRFGEVFFSG